MHVQSDRLLDGRSALQFVITTYGNPERIILQHVLTWGTLA